VAQAASAEGTGGDRHQLLVFDHILRLADQGDPRTNEVSDQMAHYMGVGIALLVTGLVPDVIRIVREVTDLWNRIGAAIDSIVKSRPFTHATTRIIPADPSAQPRLCGTIALIFQKHFGVPSVA
jgi:predicted NBD/HSP70 family sugar kinase